jgi:predicted PurR-regulated permease PerM
VLIASTLVILAIIAVVMVLFLGKTFFLPITAATIVGTMLSRSAAFLERQRVPRTIAALSVVLAALGIVALILALITAPLVQWTNRLPELAELLKSKAQMFERPLSWVHTLENLFGDGIQTSAWPMPRFEWVQPTLEFLSPTLAEIIVFFVTLLLFLSSWPDLRRALVMTFGKHDSRLRALKTVNAIEQSLGGYLLTVTTINLGVGILTGLICTITGNPNPAGLGALAATLNFIPIIGPVAMFVVLIGIGVLSFETLGGAMLAPMAFAGLTFLEGHFVTPAIIGRRLELNAFAVFLALAFWTWLWGPMGAFLSSPMLIVCLTLKEYLLTNDDGPLIPDVGS